MDKIPFMDTLPEEIKQLYNTLTELSFRKEELTNDAIVRTLIDALPALQAIKTLPPYDMIRSIRILEAFLEVLRTSTIPLTDMIKRLEIAIKTGHTIQYTMPEMTSPIQIMTAHKSKGLEFDTVFIPHLNNSIWNKKDKNNRLYLPKTLLQKDTNSDIISNEEKRRLLFVAMTRAKKELYMSNYKHKTDNTGRTDTPLSYLLETEIDATTETIKPSDTVFTSLLTPLFIQHNDATVDAYMRDKAHNFIWSASSLSCFIDTPDVFYNQYMIGAISDYSTKQQYGNAIHKSLELFLQHIKGYKTVPAYDYLECLFIDEIEKICFSNADKEHYMYNGKKALEHYYNTYKHTFLDTYLVEYNFQKQDYSGVFIKGKADVIRINSDKTACLIDYKTGKKKNKIKQGDDLWRQLVVYDILFRGSFSAYTLQEVGLLYISDSVKNSGYVPYYVSDDDRNMVYKELLDAQKRLNNLDFTCYKTADNEGSDDEDEV